ncbi:MAG: serine/threonine-protein kinase [Myxococcales bacterium]|nr:serine/threonine-protein kinase [Myxococcales bacterium]
MRDRQDDPLQLGGRLLNGRYLVQAKLGEGGMGLVYRALQVGLHRPCALKLLRPELGLSAHADELVRRFRREARLGCHLQHEGLVQVFDLDQMPDGTLYYVMELLGGRSAGDLLARLGPLPWPEAAELARQAALALAALHAARLVHRDLKPENLQVLDDGRVKVLDLGVAHVSAVLTSGPDDLTDMRTRTGQWLGTPAYMAPEQLEDARRVGPRTDIYALGLVLYELCTGTQPFRGRRLEEILQLKFLKRPLPPLRQLCREAPAALEALVASSVGPLADRPSSMTEVAAALGRLLPEEPAALQRRLAARVCLANQMPPVCSPASTPVDHRPRPWLFRATFAMGMLLLGVGLAVLSARGRQPERPLPAPRPRPASRPVETAAVLQSAAPSPPARPRPPAARALRPAMGRLRISVRPFADVFIDGVPRPQGAQHTYLLPAGQHRVRAINPLLGQDETRTVWVPVEGEAEVVIDWGTP